MEKMYLLSICKILAAEIEGAVSVSPEHAEICDALASVMDGMLWVENVMDGIE